MNTVQNQMSYYSEEELQAEKRLLNDNHLHPPAAHALSIAPPLIAAPSHSRTPSRTLPASQAAPSHHRRRSSSASTPRSSQTPPSVEDSGLDALHPRDGLSHDSASALHRLALTPLTSAAPSSPFTWSTTALQASLPLLPGQHIDVAIRLRAKEEWSHHTDALFSSGTLLSSVASQLVFPLTVLSFCVSPALCCCAQSRVGSCAVLCGAQRQ